MKERILKNNKRKLVTTLIFLIVLIIISIIVYLIFFSEKYYEIEVRKNNVEDYAKNDTGDYKTVGWLRVQGTNIDYPIIYAPDYNLNYKTDNYLWTEVNNKKLINKISVLGHNIMNLSSKPLVGKEYHSRFEQLMGFVYYDFAKENKYVQYTFNGEDYLYKIFSVSFVNDYDLDIYNGKNLSSKELNKYIKQSLDDSIFEYDVDVNGDDKIISLITCTRMFGVYDKKQFKVDARMVRKSEIITNYKVSKKEEYKDIEKLLEGEEDEEA